MFGVPIVAVGTWGFVADLMRVPSPDEPQKAIWFTLILFVVSIVLSELLRPKPDIEDARPAGLGDFQFPTTTEARVVPLVFGRVRQKGPNVIWYGDLVQQAITDRIKTGLWSSADIIKGFRYNVGVQFGLCRGSDSAPVTLTRVWIGDDEVMNGSISTETFFDIDLPNLFGGTDLGSGGVQATCDFYPGTSTQSVSPYLDTAERQQVAAITPTAPAYIGTCHVVARELTSASPVANNGGAYLGTTTTVKPWSFELERFPAIFSGQAAGEHKIGSSDCNPINVVYELFTDPEWGFGFPASDIDVGIGSSFLSAADTMITEANGFAWLLDRQMPAKDMLLELQRQIDGVVYLSHVTGKWTVKLARADYTIGSLPALNDANVSEVRDYTRGSWEDTTNTIHVQFDKRADDYKTSFAMAQDMANAIIQGDGTVSGASSTVGQLSFPGVKNSALASNIAWRELRGQSYPLARATLIVNRQRWDLAIGDVVRWSCAALEITDMPMRITRVDYGTTTDGKMTLTVVQDVFGFAAASMGAPPPTEWTAPVTSLTAFPADEQVSFEAPRAIVVRDPKFTGDAAVSKVMCAARQQGSEVAFNIGQRNSSGTPAGSFADAGDVIAFMRVGELANDLATGTAIPTSTITVTPTPDSQARIETAFNDSATLVDVGADLVHLIYVGTSDGGEFMLVRSAANNASDVDLQNVYRGVLDTVQMAHSAGTPVWLIFVGAGVTDTSFPNTNNVDVELRMRSATATYSGAVTAMSRTMAKRALRPYAPAAVRYNGTSTNYGAPDLEGDGSGLDGFGFDVDWLRRRYDPSDEVQALLADVDPDGAADVSNTEYRVRVFVDPDGANVEIPSSPTTWASGSGVAAIIPRLEIVEAAEAGTEIRVEIEARHDVNAEVQLRGRYDLTHDVVPTSALTAQFYLGGDLRANDVSNAYTALQTGTYTVNIGSTFNSQIQYRLNGGTWTNLTGYTAGSSTSGTIPGVSASDTIEIRHQVNPATVRTFLELQDTGAAPVAYGTLSN